MAVNPVASDRLRGLRAALEVLGPSCDLPDVPRLSATLDALDPVLCGQACGPAAWVPGTGMPARDWLLRPAALRDTLLASGPAAEIPDAGLVHAAALDAELGARWITRRRFERFLARHPMARLLRSDVVNGEDEDYAFVDAVLPDGRWARVRVPGAVAPEAASVDAVVAWLALSAEAFQARLPGGRRCVVGPAWEGGGDAPGLQVWVEGPEGAHTVAAVPAEGANRARGFDEVRVFGVPAPP